MYSLKELRSDHRAILVLDAASARIQSGWLAAGRSDTWAGFDGDAGQGVFACIERLGCDMNAIEAFIYCDGPGSILGIRTIAMAIRTWQAIRPRPAYHYRSLELVAHALAPEQQSLRIIADARRETWHVVEVTADGSVGPLARLPHSDLHGNAVMPENFRSWAPLPPSTRTVPYDLATLFAATSSVPLYARTLAPDAFSYETPHYVTWSPRIHRAPS
ncbi:MAG: hypothetical protein KBA71_13465 [Opitutaceae bacterium]|nr:hypothetical protein [Opitutaceae bacterium]